MTTASEKLDEKKISSERSRGEGILESVFRHLSRWQNKALGSAQEVKESIQKMERTIQSKLGERLDFSKMTASEVVAFLNDPAHFTMKERAIIHALLIEASKLKRAMQPGNKTKKFKAKRNNKQFV